MPRILLVDDEEPVLDSMEKVLQPLGHPMDRALNGRLAMQCLSENDYDVIVTDLVMPERTGLALIQTLRMRRIMVPIIVTSAFVTPDIRRELTHYERVEILAKPFRPDALTTAIRRALEPDPAGGASPSPA